MLPVIIDVVLILIVAVSVLNGVKRGFILSISGIVIMIASFYAAGMIANTYSDRFKPMIEPTVSKFVDSSVLEAKQQASSNISGAAKDELSTVGLDSLLKMGLFEGTAQKIIDDLKGSVTTVGQDFKKAVSNKVTSSVAYILTFMVAYLLMTIVLFLVMRVLDAAFRLPGLGLLNSAGGFALGAAKGMLLLFAIAWAMRYFGGIFPDETVDKTVFLKWLMKNNLLAAFFGV